MGSGRLDTYPAYIYWSAMAADPRVDRVREKLRLRQGGILLGVGGAATHFQPFFGFLWQDTLAGFFGQCLWGSVG